MRKYTHWQKIILFILFFAVFNFSPTQATNLLPAKAKAGMDRILTFIGGAFRSGPSYTPPLVYTPAVEAMHSLFESKDLNSNFALIKNKASRKDNSINGFFGNIVKSIVSALKDVLAEQIVYNKKKRGVYSIYTPKSFKKRWKIPIIKNIYDFDRLLIRMNYNLVFSTAQKRIITNIIMQIQRNILMGEKNPEKIRECTTQLFLAGPPGTAKTQLAYLISEVTGLPVIVISVSSLILLKGMAIRVLTELFLEAKMEKCFIFTDETEVILMKRSEIIAQNNAARARFNKKDSDFSSIIYDLFTVYLALTGNKSINIIAATNKPDILDPAIRRRFEHVVEMDLPERHIRKLIFLKYFARYGIRFSDSSLTKAAEIGALHTGDFQHDSNSKNALNSFSGSEIQGICIRLTEMNKPVKQRNNQMISISSTTDLVNVIQNRISIHKLFGADVRMSGGGNLSKDGLISDQSVIKNEEDRMARGKKKAVTADVISRLQLMHKIQKPRGKSQTEIYNIKFKQKLLYRDKKTQIIQDNAMAEINVKDNMCNRPSMQNQVRKKNITFGFAQINYFIKPEDSSITDQKQIECVIQRKVSYNKTDKVINNLVEGNVSEEKVKEINNSTVIEGVRRIRQKSKKPLQTVIIQVLKKSDF